MKTIFLFLLAALSLSATTVTNITCSGQTATVNATAHGLIASQGFELTGTSPQFNGTAVSVTTNSFTFTVPAGMACSTYTSGYSAVVPAQQIIEVSGIANVSNATVTFNYLYWFTTVYPTPLACNLGPSQNACPVSAWSGANAAQNAAIAAGTTVELIGNLTLPASTTASAVQTAVISQYQKMQAGYAGFLLAGGYCYNGITWAASCQ